MRDRREVLRHREPITFETGVVRAARTARGTWDVTLDDGCRRPYGMLIVANGHHRDPRWPEPRFPGRFDAHP